MTETAEEKREREASNAVCDLVYAWCKKESGGREPYSPFVADAVVMVLAAIKLYKEKTK
jgi:hypothetical protein